MTTEAEHDGYITPEGEYEPCTCDQPDCPEYVEPITPDELPF